MSDDTNPHDMHDNLGGETQLFSMSGKVALVTGGSSGIGKMIARGLLHAGARVYVASRSQQLRCCKGRAFSHR